jgi:hypothetical protein
MEDRMLTTTQQIFLCAFVFSTGMGIGGGVYETRVVYPNWSKEPTPEGLGEKLVSSGQAGAGRRYWPLVSPISALLAILNAFCAWHQTGLVRTLWLMSSISIILKSIATYAYFVPTYIRRISKPDTMNTTGLRRIVRTWTMLSPLRVLVEAFAWITGIVAVLLSSRA